MRVVSVLLIVFFLSINNICAKSHDDKAPADTIAEARVASYKQHIPLAKVASATSTIFLKQMDKSGIRTPKDFSSIVPNLYIPDYGSSMTSSIYMRGFGSRIDNPVLGFYIDDVPVMNKNSYDIDLLDIRRVDLLRGPQATLYGRNSMCGLMSLSTVSASVFQGVKASVEYGSANTVQAKASYYTGSDNLYHGVAIGYKHTDGFYTNEYDVEKCDPSDAVSLRYKLERKLTDIEFENIISISGLDQGGWPYRLMGGEIDYNDECSYKRLNLTEAFKLKYYQPNYILSSITSYQYLADEMRLDQDFRSISMFTMTQSQSEHVATHELIFKPRAEFKRSWWDNQTGLFLFYKHNSMAAPVHFKEDGIRELILSNANANMPQEVGELSFKEDEFTIGSDFRIQTYGAAIYHESYFSVNNFLFTAGLRLDYEGNHMAYDSGAKIHYKYDGIMSEYKGLYSIYNGGISNNYVELLPKVTALYDFESLIRPNNDFKMFLSLSKGYKSGGFNTQIFSDILQNQMMTDLMGEIGVYPGDESFISAKNTTYKPEHSWSYEFGLKYNCFSMDRKHRFSVHASSFYIDCLNQQITLFPPGKSTGRLMANVGQSRSIGAEAEVSYSYSGFNIAASYGYVNAKFVKYDDGINDYSGNFSPYSPENTFRVMAGYDFFFKKSYIKGLSLMVDYAGVGMIYWNESNTLSQPFYGLLGADIILDFKDFNITLRADNILSEDYDTFYFRSMQNDFLQAGKPFNWSIGVGIEF